MWVWLVFLFIGISMIAGGIALIVFRQLKPLQALSMIIGTVLCIVSLPVYKSELHYDKIIYNNVYSYKDVDANFYVGEYNEGVNKYYYVYVDAPKGGKIGKSFLKSETVLMEVDDGKYFIREYKEKWDAVYYYIYLPKGFKTTIAYNV